MIPDPLIFLIRVGAAVVEAYHVATVIAAEAVLSAVAAVALLHAREGKPIPAVPPWATQALCVKQARRLSALAHEDAYTTAHLNRIRAERAILSTLTLGA